MATSAVVRLRDGITGDVLSSSYCNCNYCDSCNFYKYNYCNHWTVYCTAPFPPALLLPFSFFLSAQWAPFTGESEQFGQRPSPTPVIF